MNPIALLHYLFRVARAHGVQKIEADVAPQVAKSLGVEIDRARDDERRLREAIGFEAFERGRRRALQTMTEAAQQAAVAAAQRAVEKVVELQRPAPMPVQRSNSGHKRSRWMDMPSAKKRKLARALSSLN